jgi:geranylgeranyl pyrophosphate synthase
MGILAGIAVGIAANFLFEHIDILRRLRYDRTKRRKKGATHENSSMWHEYPTLAPELASALTLIEKQITTNNTPVAKAIMEMINGGGKLLRPAYCLLFSRFQDTDREKMIALAAAIETLHTATLIHDDIIDKSPTRRNQVTIQKQFGPDTAVYAGDYLFVVCFKLWHITPQASAAFNKTAAAWRKS